MDYPAIQYTPTRVLATQIVMSVISKNVLRMYSTNTSTHTWKHITVKPR